MKGFFFSFFLAITGSVFAQYTLEGVVLDGMTRKPVVLANVYLDATTHGTTTDSFGKFRIIVPEVINTSLIISYIGYEKVYIRNPFRALPKTIFLEEHVETLNEVTVMGKTDPRKRKDLLEVFKKYFFGDRAYYCKILNENDLRLIHDEENHEIIGTAQKPLDIINNYLKYLIQFDLIEFKIILSPDKLESYESTAQPADPRLTTITQRMNRNNPLLNIPVKHKSIIGAVRFTDIGADRKKLKKRREADYYQSFRYFYYLLASHQLKINESGEPDFSAHFQLINPNYEEKTLTFYDQDSLLSVSPSLDYPSIQTVVVRPELKDSLTGYQTIPAAYNKMNQSNEALLKNRWIKDRGKLKMLYSYRPSTITFYTDTFHIDKYGNTDLYKNFNLDGHFASQSIGYLLPLDYSPEQATGKKPAASQKDVIPLAAEERIRYFLEKQTTAFPQENIHVHIDKTNYVAGETIWFRAFLTDYRTNTPSVESRYIYGELYDPGDSLVIRIRIRQDSDDVFKGYFDLPPDLPEGHYRLRFYSRYMEEAGEACFFNQTVFIGNAFSKIHPIEEVYRHIDGASSGDSLSTASAPEYDVSFFPEGGALPADVPIRVAFKALSADGLGLPVSGTIVNAEGNEVTTFTSNALGMGSFSVIIPPGQRYAALCRNSQGLEKQFELSEAKANVINLKTVQNKDSVIIETLVSGSPPSDTLHLLMQCRGTIYANEALIIGEKRFFAKDTLPSGVIHLLLLDQNLKPLSERFIFNLNPKDLARVSITPSKETYKKREQIELSIDMSTHDTRPIQAGFSISVSLSDPPPPPLNLTPNNYTLNSNNHPLLTNNYTLNSNTYPLLPNNYTLEEIAPLLLTQEWNRYNIPDILQGYNQKPKLLPESTPEISGRIVYGMLQNKKAGQFIKINAVGINHNQLPGTVAEVVDTQFDFAYNEYPNGTTYALQTGPNSFRSLNPNLSAFPQNTIRRPYTLNVTPSAVETFRGNFEATIAPYRDEWLHYRETVLARGDSATGISPLSPRRIQDKIIPSRELWKNKKITLGQFLSTVDGVAVRIDDNDVIHLRYQTAEGSFYDYVVIVDGRWMNAQANMLYDAQFNDNGDFSLEALLSLTVDRIEEIEIIQSPAPPIALNTFGNLVVNDPLLYGISESLSPISIFSPRSEMVLSHPGYMGTILITTTARNAGIDGALPIAPLGYQVNRDFYAPAYTPAYKPAMQTKALPDMRTTLYWNPDVQTDDAGQATIRFFAADRTADYTITIEGITKEGIFIRQTAIIHITD